MSNINYAVRDMNNSAEIVLLEMKPMVKTTPLGVIEYVCNPIEPYGFSIPCDLFFLIFGRILGRGEITEIKFQLKEFKTPAEAISLGWAEPY